MKRFLIIIFTGLIWCNLLSAKIINIDNKLNLDVPQNHKLLKIDKDFDIYGDFLEIFEMFEPQVFFVGPSSLVDLFQSMMNGEDPMNNKYIASFMKKAERKASTTSDPYKLNKWYQKEIKRTLKQAKIDFDSYVLISEQNINELDSSDLGFDINEFLNMSNSELKQAANEIRKEITKNDNKTINFGSGNLVIKKFEIGKNQSNEIFFHGEAKLYMTITDELSIYGNAAIYTKTNDNKTYAIISECYFTCPDHGKKFNKMIKPLSSNNMSVQNTSISNTEQSDLVKQLEALNDLYKSGVLTKEEFEKAKKKLLN